MIEGVSETAPGLDLEGDGVTTDTHAGERSVDASRLRRPRSPGGAGIIRCPRPEDGPERRHGRHALAHVHRDAASTVLAGPGKEHDVVAGERGDGDLALDVFAQPARRVAREIDRGV